MRPIARVFGAALAAAALTIGVAGAAAAQGDDPADNPGLNAEFCLMPSGSGTNPNCRIASDGSIRVLFGGAKTFTFGDADRVIVEAWETMRRYRKDLGLSKATTSADAPIQIIVVAGDGDPNYSWLSGNIELGEGTASKIGMTKPTADFRHELVHLVQGRAYDMASGRVFDATTWWLEVTAEMLPFYLDADAAPYNAGLYGNGSHGTGNTNIVQHAPYQWPGDAFYQHAQRLYATTCKTGCVFTFDQVIEALNTAVYPLSEAARKAAFTTALEPYAKYLLTGKHPDGTVIDKIADGTAIGDRVSIIGSKKVHNDLGVTFSTASLAQPKLEAEGIIEAKISADSVYVLTFASGSAAAGLMQSVNAPHTGAPLMFRAAPGPEFWYRVDGGPILHHDGGSDLVLGPIHSDLGIGEVRIVAIAPDQPETFYGTFEPLDLAGDWVFRTSGKAKELSFKCAKGSKRMDPRVIEFVSSRATGSGTYEAGASKTEFEWVQNKPLSYFFEVGGPKGAKPRPVVYEGRLEAEGDVITGTLSYDAPSPRKGDVGVDLDVAAEMTFDKLTIPKTKKAKKKAKGPTALMVLEGTGIVETDLLVVHVKNNDSTKQKLTWFRDHCVLRVKVPVTGTLYAEGKVKVPKQL